MILILLLNLPDNLPYFLSQHIFPLDDLLNLGVELDNVDLLPLVLLLHIGGDRKVEVVCFNLLKRGKVREMRDLRAVCVGVYDAVDVFGGQFVVIRDLDALIRRVNEKRIVIGFSSLHHQNAGGNGGAEKEVGGQLNDAVHKVVFHKIPPYLLLRSAAVQNTRETDNRRRAVCRKPRKAVHDKRHIRLAFRRQHARRRKARIIDKQRVVIALPFDGVRRVGDDQFKRLVIPMRGVGQRILAGNIEFVKSDVMQKHIDAAEVIGRDVDLLPVKAVADGVLAKHLFGFQQQRTRTARGVHRPY